MPSAYENTGPQSNRTGTPEQTSQAGDWILKTREFNLAAGGKGGRGGAVLGGVGAVAVEGGG